MKNDKLESVKEAINKHIEFRQHTVAPSTLRADKSKSRKLVRYFVHRSVADVTHSDIQCIINRLHRRYKNKTINEYLTILRAVFKRAKRDGAINIDPMEGIENLTIVTSEPTPFEKVDIQKMYDTSVECLSGKNASLFNILTGLRIGELLALGWDDIDWQRKVLHVRRAKVLNDYKVPKTPDSIREVELNELALSLLKNQLEITGKKRARTVSVLQSDNKTWLKEKVRFVFYNNKTKRPFLHAKQFNKTFFSPFLIKAKVGHRGASQLRHTYASQNLTAGISKDWIACQMGHTGTNMIDKHYGRWIRSDAPDFANAAANHLSDVFGYSENISVKTSSDVSPDVLALANALQDKPELKALIQGVIGGAL
ncbi:site-specific integrase [Vibrio splendidus]|uniref:tyrosine-type recombinase/integrase n=1 Tax=Vibrio splendidus TaxID=29497 RepID=UPI00148BC25B|nr:site-specific integrase [Vibrio splendidus]